MKRSRIVLYNPRAVFYTMPLALVAIGSRLDRSRCEVRIVDGRLEPDPVATVLREVADPSTLCLGVTVLTGAPIRDALDVTRAVRQARPDLPIVWGGWHPSLFPADTLADASLDAVVVGQGEETFAEIVDRLSAGAALTDVAGVVAPACAAGDAPPARRAGDAPPVGHGAPRAMVDVNALPPHDYSVIPVERYFALKRQRQLDYVSSQGCRFRCTFCADPYVYNRGWSGLDPARMGDELERLARRYEVRDVGFQDETFFTSAKRVAAIADEFGRRGLRFTWMATMRADQGARLDDRVLADCRRAGLRRVMVGVESGSQPMLDWMKKDITMPQVFATAEKCRRQGIAVLFNLIVGFPDESPDSVQETLNVAKRLRGLGPDFQVALFYYKPYPGSQMVDLLVRQGYRLPKRLDEWADFDDERSPSPWIEPRKHDLIERFQFYQRIGWARQTSLRAPLQALARWRCRRDLYAFPFEKAIVEWVRPQVTT